MASALMKTTTAVSGLASSVQSANKAVPVVMSPTRTLSKPACFVAAAHSPCSIRRQLVRTYASPGGSVLDAPLTLPGKEISKELSQKKKPTYKVLLHNDNYNRREYVVKVLLKVVKDITMDDALEAMQEAHETGVAMVISCPQEDAERYCEGLRLNGLTSTIEPGY